MEADQKNDVNFKRFFFIICYLSEKTISVSDACIEKCFILIFTVTFSLIFSNKNIRLQTFLLAFFIQINLLSAVSHYKHNQFLFCLKFANHKISLNLYLLLTLNWNFNNHWNVEYLPMEIMLIWIVFSLIKIKINHRFKQIAVWKCTDSIWLLFGFLIVFKIV